MSTAPENSGPEARVPSTRRVPLYFVALLLIVAGAMALRLYGLQWDEGFPWTPHPDERAILMKVGELSPPSLGEIGVLFDADDSPWNPRWFPYGSLPLYLLKAVQLGYDALSGSELRDLRVAGRLISAIADGASVLLVYLLGTRVYGRREGVLAAALVALAVLHIQLSHFFAVDTLLGLFTLAALYFLWRVAVKGRLRDSLLAGIFIGIGLATKVSLAPIYLAFITAHLAFATGLLEGRAVLSRPRWVLAAGAAVLGLGTSVLVFLVAQPYALLDWSRFLADFNEQSEMVRRIRDYPYTRQYIDTTPYLYQVRQLAAWGLGWPLGIVAWAGLAYVALRGIRISFGLVYLVLGVAFPAALLLYSTSLVAVAAASLIAAAALTATLPLRSVESRAGVLLLSWVVPYVLITGALEVKFMRYLLPVTPLLILFGSRLAVSLWDQVSGRRPRLRPLMIGGLALLLGSTGLYALSYVAIYSQPHTAIRTAEWINADAREGAVILREHWEEGVPGLHGYDIRELGLYEPDSQSKLQGLSKNLAEADYVMFYSNRLYGTIPRLPERYPQTSGYYRLLFSGGLGYQLASVETAYPRLGAISLVDDTLGRPRLPEPARLASLRPSGLALNLGFADESFSVYDHPVGLVFKNVERLDEESIRGAINRTAAQAGTAGAATGLLLAPDEVKAQREGGTWTDIVREEGWTNRVPVLAWLLFLEIVAVAALPIGFVIFRPLPDRGYLLSKPLGLLLVVLVVWLLASFQWVSFSRGSIVLAIALLGLVSALVVVKRRGEIVDFVRREWPILLTAEAVFLLAFFAFVGVRMANPDLWHPFRGGEKPMDLAYLTAVLRSTYMPPYDPWFSGGYINYYYWGQMIVASIIKATGITPGTAFNIAVPTFFALTAASAFSIVYNLAEGTLRSRRVGPGAGLPRPESSQPGSGTFDDSGGKQRRHESRRGPLLAGLAGAAFVSVLGNLDGAIQGGHWAWRTFLLNKPSEAFDFWRSSRMMPPDPPGHEITEFPFFTFLFGDLHAHMMALPFTLLALGLGLSVVLSARRSRSERDSEGRVVEIVRLAMLGVAVGALRLINTWDFPTYLLIAAAAVFLASYLKNGGLSLMVLTEAGVKSVLLFAAGYLVFLPFHQTYETFFSSLELTTNKTVLWQFLAITGLFIFIIGSFLLKELKDVLLPVGRSAYTKATHALAVSGRGAAVSLSGEEGRRVGALRLSALTIVAGVLALAAAVYISSWLGSTIPFVVALGMLVVTVAFRSLRELGPESPQLSFVSVLIGVALLLVVGLDIYRVEGDIDRMNSVFKVYLQVWVLLAVASAYLLWRIADGRLAKLGDLSPGKKVWLVALGVLLVSAMVYPLLGTKDRLRDRFNDQVLPPTLDGLAYMRENVYHDREGDIELAADYDGIVWLQENLKGSPVVLEGLTPIYRWGGRVSVNTGLPSVLGWQWHQEQQRWDYRDEISRRAADVNRAYSTTDGLEALAILRKYGVEYVYVGQLERLYYPEAGIGKFENGDLADHLDEVYRNKHVRVYQVRSG